MARRRTTLFLCLFVLGAAGIAAAADISLHEAIEESAASLVEKLPPKTRVAVVAMEAESESLAAFIMDEITSVLVDSDIEVAERENLGYILKELHFQASGLADDKTAAQVGKQLGAKYVIKGQLVHIGSSYRYRLAAINVESAIQEAAERRTVKNDRDFKKMLAALNKNKQVTREAKYAVTENTTPNTAGKLLDRGILFADRGDYDLAIEDFTEAIKLDPNIAAAYFQRGNAYREKGDNDHAIVDYNQAIKLDPNDATAYNNRGYAYGEKGDHDRAITDCNQAIKLDLNCAPAYNNRGIAYAKKGDYDRAIKDYTQAIKLDSNNAEVYIKRGIAYLNKDDLDNVILDCTQAIKLNPNEALAWQIRGVVYFRKDDSERAFSDLTQAVKLDPNDEEAKKWLAIVMLKDFMDQQEATPSNAATNFINQGNAYFSKGDYDRAITEYSEAIKIDPNNANAYNNRGIAYIRKGDNDRAIVDLTQAVKLDPNISDVYTHLSGAYHNRGIAYAAKGDYDRAIIEYNQAIKINPNFALAYSGLVFCPKHLATSLPRLWARFFAPKPRQTTVRLAFCRFKSHPKSTAIITQSVSDRTLGGQFEMPAGEWERAPSNALLY